MQLFANLGPGKQATLQPPALFVEDPWDAHEKEALLQKPLSAASGKSLQQCEGNIFSIFQLTTIHIDRLGGSTNR